MGDTRFGVLGDAKRAVRSYVQSSLSATTTAVAGDNVLNLEVDFARFLQGKGINRDLASELAAEQYLALQFSVEKHIETWNDQGVLAPIGFHVDKARTLVMWRHERFEELTGLTPPARELFAAQEWVAGLVHRDFLLPCACYLRSIGCDRIYVTDGTKDEGIDLIGLIMDGPFRSTAVYVQAKSQGRISGDELLQEFAKFRALPQTVKHLHYLDALGASRLKDGMSFVYLVLANGDFDHAAVENGRCLGALLRSRRQIADQLSRTYSRERLDTLMVGVTIPDGPDLQRDLAPHLNP